MAWATNTFRAHRIFNTVVEAGNLNVSGNTKAVASICEVAGGVTPFLGGATMRIYNVVPRDNRFDIRGEIDWDSDLDVRVTVIFEN